jgi:L-seryl-tRNA(Ser) seleniumtransferase
MNRTALRSIPSVDQILRDLPEVDFPRPVIVAVVRREIADFKSEISKSKGQVPDLLSRIRMALDDLRRWRLQPLINGTGILIHTNFGRAPLCEAAADALGRIARSYSNLEYDLGGGNRGLRAAYVEHNLAVLCGAPACAIVNNCAAALVLILRHFAGGEPRNQVIISRGELIQIGGGFRIPEILQASGAALREIGTTNKTTLTDYTKAITRQTALILKVHRSNFFMDGFVASPDTREIAALARKHRILFVEDLGSGATQALHHSMRSATGDLDPTPAQILGDGVDLVPFSGDKLLGGPQAGIIAGKARLVAALKTDPLFRALRCDKLTICALQETVDSLLSLNPEPQTPNPLPLLQLLQTPLETLQARAKAIVDSVTGSGISIAMGAGHAQVGGGSLPRIKIPSVTLDLTVPSGPAVLARRLRSGTPPVIGYISGGRLRLDLRTVFAHQDGQLIAALRFCGS